MSKDELFLKAINEINTKYYDNDGGAISIYLSFETDGCDSIITYNSFTVIDSDWIWSAEEIDDPRYGKSEYACLVEDIVTELNHISEAASYLSKSASMLVV